MCNGASAGCGVPAVESTNAHSEGKVEGRLAGLEREVLDRHLSEAEPASLDLSTRAGQSLGNHGGRAVDAQDVTRADPAGDLTSGCPGPAADLQHPDPPL